MIIWFISEEGLSEAVHLYDTTEIIQEIQGLLLRHGGFHDLLSNTEDLSKLTESIFFIPYLDETKDKILDFKQDLFSGRLKEDSNRNEYVNWYVDQCYFTYNKIIEFIKNELVQPFIGNKNNSKLTFSQSKSLFFMFTNGDIDRLQRLLYKNIRKALKEKYCNTIVLTNKELKQMIHDILYMCINSISA